MEMLRERRTAKIPGRRFLFVIPLRHLGVRSPDPTPAACSARRQKDRPLVQTVASRCRCEIAAASIRAQLHPTSAALLPAPRDSRAARMARKSSCPRVLQIIKINFSLLACGYLARSGEEIRPFRRDPARQYFRKIAGLRIAVNWLQRHIDMHAVTAGGLGISRQPDQVAASLARAAPPPQCDHSRNDTDQDR